MISVRQIIADVLEQHKPRIDYNHPGYGKCRCGYDPEGWDADGNDTPAWHDHVADYLMATFRNAGVVCEVREVGR